MTYVLHMLNGDPRHLVVGSEAQLSPLDESAAHAAFAEPPSFDDLDGEYVWAGDALVAEISLSRSEDGQLRSIDVGLHSSEEPPELHRTEARNLLRKLKRMADQLNAQLYDPQTDQLLQTDEDVEQSLRHIA
jgi:hypothetical protein